MRKQILRMIYLPLPISSREVEIIELASNGMTDEMIAEKLKLSHATVTSYWVRIRSKMRVTSRTHAVANYLRIKLAVGGTDELPEYEAKAVNALLVGLNLTNMYIAVLDDTETVVYSNEAAGLFGDNAFGFPVGKKMTFLPFSDSTNKKIAESFKSILGTTDSKTFSHTDSIGTYSGKLNTTVQGVAQVDGGYDVIVITQAA